MPAGPPQERLFQWGWRTPLALPASAGLPVPAPWHDFRKDIIEQDGDSPLNNYRHVQKRTGKK
jgi:hypothetical protein